MLTYLIDFAYANLKLYHTSVIKHTVYERVQSEEGAQQIRRGYAAKTSVADAQQTRRG